MADIELVIKLDEQTYNNIVRNEYFRTDVIALHTALVNGTPLPKGHGRIGDLDLAYKAIEAYQDTIRSVGEFDAEKASALTLLGRCKELISGVDTIIEARKEQE